MKNILPLVLVFGIFFIPQPISAQQPDVQNTVTISPAFQELELVETASQSAVTITVTNTSIQPVTLEVLPSTVDQQDLSGRISFELFSGAANQTFPFLSVSVDRFVLEPQQSQDVSVTVTNRTSLRPGGTYVGIVFRTVLEAPPTQQVILPAVASLLLINKQGGETYNLSLKEVIGIPKNVALTIPNKLGLVFANDGNTHLQPRGTISVTGLFNRLVAQSTVNESSLYILPGRQRMIQQTVQPASRLLPIDVVWVEINGTSGNDRTPYSYETSFIYISIWGILALMLCIAAAVVFVIRKNRIRI